MWGKGANSPFAAIRGWKRRWRASASCGVPCLPASSLTGATHTPGLPSLQNDEEEEARGILDASGRRRAHHLPQTRRRPRSRPCPQSQRRISIAAKGESVTVLPDFPLAIEYTGGVVFQWDSSKAAGNRRKHGVDFNEAATVLNDTPAATFPDPDHSSALEQRSVTIGQSQQGRILVVVHTERGERIRIISARKANKLEEN